MNLQTGFQIGATYLGQFASIGSRKREELTAVFQPFVGTPDPVRVKATRTQLDGIVSGKGVYHIAVKDDRLVLVQS
jgi:hypothetical protein